MFDTKWRVRRRRSLNGSAYPWAVDYRPWWWPGWFWEDTFRTKEAAIEHATAMRKEKVLKIP